MQAPTRLIVLIAALLSTSPLRSDGQVHSSLLAPGDIVYTDSGNAIEGGFVVKVDPDTGAQTVLASGGYLSLPFDLGMDALGRLILTDSGRLIRLNPGTEDQELLGDGSDRILGYPAGIAVDWSGQVLVTTGASILRLNPASGQVSVLSSGGYFDFPIGLSIASPGQLFVLNLGFPPQVLPGQP